MTQIIILGNGFDLCHGLQTSYNDFYYNYLANCFVKALNNNKYKHEDSLISINLHLILNSEYQNYLNEIDVELNSTNNNEPKKIDIIKKRINELESLRFLNSKTNILQFNSEFSRKLYFGSLINWLDIEVLYYDELISSFNRGLNSVIMLNENMNILRNELIEYIKDVSTKDIKENESIKNILFHIKANRREKDRAEIIFLNFNYTSTIKSYKPYFLLDHQIINIHGSVGNESNPVILGYGDDSDSNYLNFEQSNNRREYLEFNKSFWYYRTENYSNLFSTLENGEYEVNIIGHSCGISDKTILSAIFNHRNCKKITIYPYKKNDTESDLHEKVLNISQHFPINTKHEMRLKIKYDPKINITSN